MSVGGHQHLRIIKAGPGGKVPSLSCSSYRTDQQPQHDTAFGFTETIPRHLVADILHAISQRP
jgi:hypothetical protein